MLGSQSPLPQILLHVTGNPTVFAEREGRIRSTFPVSVSLDWDNTSYASQPIDANLRFYPRQTS